MEVLLLLLIGGENDAGNEDNESIASVLVLVLVVVVLVVLVLWLIGIGECK